MFGSFSNKGATHGLTRSVIREERLASLKALSAGIVITASPIQFTPLTNILPQLFNDTDNFNLYIGSKSGRHKRANSQSGQYSFV